MKNTMMRSQHRWIYVGSIVVLLAMLVGGLFAFRNVHSTVSANSKADQLADQLRTAGYPVPDHNTLVRTLGEDGGVLCTDPGNPLVKAQAKIALANGAGGPGQRPVISDNTAINAAELAIAVYCPDKLGDFKKAYGDFKYADTVKN